ncbi:MAG: hypothetical protein OXG87_07875 [Gemmatimonadetes bacterium]|nr:hypothetical protein [Gemmatimonadota bacterium]
MNTIPAELNAIAGQLQNYDAPGQTIQLDSNCKLTYEILQWAKTHPEGLTDDRPIGTVEISRYNKENCAEYQIVEKRNGGGREIYEATVTTARDERIGESITNWKLAWYQAETPDKRLFINGTVRDATIEMNTSKKHLSANTPISCQWILPLALANRATPMDEAFTTIDELTYYKTDQLLHGPEQIESNDQSFLSYRHTGYGTLPIHYVFDPQNRPVFVTFTLLSWILRDIELI